MPDVVAWVRFHIRVVDGDVEGGTLREEGRGLQRQRVVVVDGDETRKGVVGGVLVQNSRYCTLQAHCDSSRP